MARYGIGMENKEKFEKDLRSMSLNLAIAQVETLALLEILGVENFETIFTPKNRLTTTTTSTVAEQCFLLEAKGFVQSMKFIDPNSIEFYVSHAGLAAFKWAMMKIILDNEKQPQP